MTYAEKSHANNLIRTFQIKQGKMGPKKKPEKDPIDPETERQYREEEIARKFISSRKTDTITQVKEDCRY